MRWPSSLRMDQEILLSAGHSVQRLRMYPYFDAAHYILVRHFPKANYSQPKADGFGCPRWSWSKQCRFLAQASPQLLALVHGSLLRGQFFGQLSARWTNGGRLQAAWGYFACEPILVLLEMNVSHKWKATAIWYLVFYSPFDAVYRLAKFTPIKLALSVMKECQRVYKVFFTKCHWKKCIHLLYRSTMVSSMPQNCIQTRIW